MRQVSRIKALQALLARARPKGRLGFVPTMGAFHEGHLSLMQKAKQECDFTLVSLFVNPLQFGPQEDLAVYPRSLSSDRKKAVAAGVDLLWTPSERDLFPPTFQTTITLAEIGRLWEGASRPGHFSGVATIVAKLLQVVRPDRLYLGQKDYQQTCVISQMMQDLHFDTKIRVCPTLREKDGLAMSSRNVRLSPADRIIAPFLYRALHEASTRVRAGERKVEPLIKQMRALLLSEPRIQIDYLVVCDPHRLEPIDRIEKKAILLAAVTIDSVRLIDNIFLKTDQ